MKYVALTLSTVATLLLVLALTGIAKQIPSGGSRLPPVQNAMSPLSPQQLSDQGDVKHALQALGQFPAARFLNASGNGQSAGGAQASSASWTVADGSIFSVSPQAKETPSPTGRTVAYREEALRPLPLPRVSVILQSGAEGKAMVNGNLVRVGDAVDNGMVVHRIDIDGITFASGKELLEVRMPLERLRVLGAFPQSPRGN